MPLDSGNKKLTLRIKIRRIILITIFFSLAFFWIIPESGHRILLAKNFYGLGISKLTNFENIKCGVYKNEKIEGRFLFIYPYSAYITTNCGTYGYFSGEYDYYQYVIIVSPPHTFLTKIAEIPAGSPGGIVIKTDSMDINKEASR